MNDNAIHLYFIHIFQLLTEIVSSFQIILKFLINLKLKITVYSLLYIKYWDNIYIHSQRGLE